jgi:spore germination protein
MPTAAVYRVQRGDTLKSIADKFGVSVNALVEVNQLADPNAIVVGQYLVIPEKP